MLPQDSTREFSDFGLAINGLIADQFSDIVKIMKERERISEKSNLAKQFVMENISKITFSSPRDESLVQALISDTNLFLNQELSSNEEKNNRLSLAIEKFVEVKLFRLFRETGKLAGKADVLPCDDDDYIGAVLGFAQELSRYCVGRAIDRDLKTISLCRDVVSQINSKMLSFDFRNGPLRRKYDGLKYSLKKIEDLMYEFSLMEEMSIGRDDSDLVSEQSRKRMKIAANIDSLITPGCALVCENDFATLLLRYEENDRAREDVIKRSRDVQKFSKQSIYAVHRENLEEACFKYQAGMQIAKSIMEVVTKKSFLRQGAFSNALEELAEAALLIEWMKNNKIISRADLEIVNADEYVGALSDFTGELGRVAVAKATKRELSFIQEIHQVDLSILMGFLQISFGDKYAKKAEAVNNNLKKVEDIIFDLSLLAHSKRPTKIRDNSNETEQIQNTSAYLWYSW